MLLATARSAAAGLGVCAALALGLARPASAGSGALPTTHTFHGTITLVTDGSIPGTADLTSAFTVGDDATLVMTIDRAMAPIASDANTASYLNFVLSSSFTFGTYSVGPIANPLSTGGVENDVPDPPNPAYDSYIAELALPSGPPVGNAQLNSVDVVLQDDDGTAISGLALPGNLGDLAQYEVKVLQLIFVDTGASTTGIVHAEISDATTPAAPTSWGKIKGMYRN